MLRTNLLQARDQIAVKSNLSFGFGTPIWQIAFDDNVGSIPRGRRKEHEECYPEDDDNSCVSHHPLFRLMETTAKENTARAYC
jgi:hypothetical protein